MIYHGLPVIPEDDVLDVFVLNHTGSNAMHHTHSDRSGHKNGTSMVSMNHNSRDDYCSNNNCVDGYAPAPFGYVAILRNDTLLLEVGRSVFEIVVVDGDNTDHYNNNNNNKKNNTYDNVDHNSIMDDTEVTDTMSELDQTILGLLRKDPIPGWDRYIGSWIHDPKNDNSDQTKKTNTNIWTGLRFHCYDDHYDNNDDIESIISDDHGTKKETGIVLSTSPTVIWSFCVVYRNDVPVRRNISQQPESLLELTIQQWMIEHLVQFTKLFRKNDVVWKTGTTLSCQYVFAPAVQQRMLLLLQEQILKQQQQQPSTTTSSNQHPIMLLATTPTPTTTDHYDGTTSVVVVVVDWMHVADAIIERNHVILKHITTSRPFHAAATTTTSSDVPPFVSDESDNDDDSYEQQPQQQNAFMEEEEEEEEEMDDDDNNSLVYDDDDTATSSSSDEDVDDTLLLSGTPERTGALPISYFYNNQYDNGDNNNSDDTMTYIDHIVASTTSIWTKQCNVTIKPISNLSETNSSSEMTPFVSQIDNDNNKGVEGMPLDTSDAKLDQNSNNDISNDDETIPLICFVEDQVDAQHSDLWKRSPKCITKAVALGITNPTSQPSPKPPPPPLSPPVSQVSVPSTLRSTTRQLPDQLKNIELTSLSSLNRNNKSKEWWEIFAQKTAVTLDLVWKSIITTKLDDNNKTNGDNHKYNSQDQQQKSINHNECHPCFWCKSIFPSKISAMQ